MPLSTTKPTFIFFKMAGCGACEQFESRFFRQLTQDPEVLAAVNIDEVMFGRGEEGEEYSLKENYPDFAAQVKYAPFLWLSAPYDESKGYHLSPTQMMDSQLNTRLVGVQYRYSRDTTYPGLKEWVLTESRKLSGAGGADSKPRFLKSRSAASKLKRS